MELIERRRTMMSAPHIKKDEGEILTFDTNFAKPLKMCQVGIEPVQDLHGQEHAYFPGGGKNLISDEQNVENGFVANSRLLADGTTTEDNALFTSVYFPIVEGTTYTWSGHSNLNTASLCFYDANKQLISSVEALNALPKTVVAPTGSVYARCNGYNSDYVSTGFTSQLEKGAAASEFVPYSNVCPITGWDKTTINKRIEFHRLIPKNGQTNWKSNGITVDYVGNGKYHIYGKSVATSNTYIFIEPFTVPSGDGRLIEFNNSVGLTGIKILFYETETSTSSFDNWTLSPANRKSSAYSAAAGKNISKINIQINSGITVDMFIQPQFSNTNLGESISVTFPAFGKNLFDKVHATKYKRSLASSTWDYNSGSTSFAFKCEPNTDYTITAIHDNLAIFRGAYINVELPTSNSVSPTLLNKFSNTAQGSETVHTGADATYIVVQVSNSLADDVLIQIEKGTTASAYEEFNNIAYSGTLDMLSGELIVDSEMMEITSVTTSESKYGVKRASGLNTTVRRGEMLCDVLAVHNGTVGAMPDNSIVLYASTARNYDAFAIKINGTPAGSNISQRIASINAELAKLSQAGTPLTVVFYLAEPIRYQLTPQQLTAFKGTNNIWADTGETRVAYYGH